MRQPQGCKGINGFTRLGNNNYQRFLINQRFLISKFGSNGHGYRNAQKRLHNGTSHHAGIHGSSAGNDLNLTAFLKNTVRYAVLAKIRYPFVDPRQNGIAQGIRLLMNFLQHKMRKTIFHSSIHVPVDCHDLRVSFGIGVIQMVYMDFIGSQLYNMLLRHHKILTAIRNKSC